MTNQERFQKFLNKHNIKFVKFNLFDKYAVNCIKSKKCDIIIRGVKCNSVKKIFKQENHSGLAAPSVRLFTINHETLSHASQKHFLIIMHELCHILLNHDCENEQLKELEAEYISNKLVTELFGYNNTDNYWLVYYNRTINLIDRFSFIFLRYWKRKKVYKILFDEFKDYDLSEIVIDKQTKYL